MNTQIIEELELLEKWMQVYVSTTKTDERIVALWGLYTHARDLHTQLREEFDALENELPEKTAITILDQWIGKIKEWRPKCGDIVLCKKNAIMNWDILGRDEVRSTSLLSVISSLLFESVSESKPKLREEFMRERLEKAFSNKEYHTVLYHVGWRIDQHLVAINRTLQRIQDIIINPDKMVLMDLFINYKNKYKECLAFRQSKVLQQKDINRIGKKTNREALIDKRIERLTKEIAQSEYAEDWEFFFEEEGRNAEFNGFIYYEYVVLNDVAIGDFLYNHPQVAETEQLLIHLMQWSNLKNAKDRWTSRQTAKAKPATEKRNPSQKFEGYLRVLTSEVRKNDDTVEKVLTFIRKFALMIEHEERVWKWYDLQAALMDLECISKCGATYFGRLVVSLCHADMEKKEQETRIGRIRKSIEYYANRTDVNSNERRGNIEEIKRLFAQSSNISAGEDDKGVRSLSR